MRRKTVIVGAGHVGAHVASALSMEEICEEIVLIDRDERKAWAHAQDIQDTAAYAGRTCVVRDGTWKELADADVCVISVCGKIFREDRLEELDEALDIMDELVPELARADFHGVIVSITNPCDLVALYLHERTEYPVIGTGTALDSARFRVRIGRGLGLMPSCVEAFCVGEHGDSQVQVWSQARIGGRFLDELAREEPERYGRLDRTAVEKSTTEAGWAILQGKGSTEYGIGAAAAEVIRAVLCDSRTVLPCSIPFRRTAGSALIYTSMPAIIGADGYPTPVPFRLNGAEQAAFERSCQLLEKQRAEHLDPRLKG
ncbi:MAG: hypothetical protein LUC94_11545 [Clostridiales bacterium]|nr:hypothetical protein [Clostridiales bacterium]